MVALRTAESDRGGELTVVLASAALLYVEESQRHRPLSASGYLCWRGADPSDCAGELEEEAIGAASVWPGSRFSREVSDWEALVGEARHGQIRPLAVVARQLGPAADGDRVQILGLNEALEREVQT